MIEPNLEAINLHESFYRDLFRESTVKNTNFLSPLLLFPIIVQRGRDEKRQAVHCKISPPEVSGRPRRIFSLEYLCCTCGFFSACVCVTTFRLNFFTDGEDVLLHNLVLESKLLVDQKVPVISSIDVHMVLDRESET